MQIETPPAKRNLISLTPLIDIVFILLVFFMLASTFSKWSYLGIQIGEAEATDMDAPTQTVVGLKSSDQAMPRFAVEGGILSLEALTQHLRNEMDRNAKHSVLLLPTPDLPLQKLVLALETLQRDFGDNVSLAMQADDDSATAPEASP